MNMLLRPVRSSLGRKYVMAVTGLLLIGFVIMHMAGNMLVYVGRDALNAYAKALKDHPALLWAARLGLLIVFVIHVVLGLMLASRNRQARGQAYVYEDTVEANWASRHMLLTGLVLLAFIIYHLAHFTFGWIGPPHYPVDPARHDEVDVYKMVVHSFRVPAITASYVLAMVFLWLHLWHGAYSWFQSLGINHPRYNCFLRALGPVVSTIVFLGNSSMPLAILFGLVGRDVT